MGGKLGPTHLVLSQTKLPKNQYHILQTAYLCLWEGRGAGVAPQKLDSSPPFAVDGSIAGGPWSRCPTLPRRLGGSASGASFTLGLVSRVPFLGGVLFF